MSIFSPSYAFSFWTLFLRYYVYYLLVTSISLCAILSLFELADRQDESGRSKTAWTLTILGLPAIGGAAYLLYRGRLLSSLARRVAAWSTILILVAVGYSLIRLFHGQGPTGD